MDNRLEAWIDAHPFLAGMASFQGLVEASARAEATPVVFVPRWAAYAREHVEGVPLLLSLGAGLDVRDWAADALERVAARLVGAGVPAGMLVQCRHVREQLRQGPEARKAVVRWLLGDPGAQEPQNPGLLWFLGWTVLAHLLGPLVSEYAVWRGDEARWKRPMCPTCGAPPAMAQLVDRGDGPERLLSCACCRTRWRFKRLGCPLCSAEGGERTELLELEDERELRVDLCTACKGFLKTYVGEGEEDLFLADWTSLHLDVLARERGYARKGATLYQL